MAQENPRILYIPAISRSSQLGETSKIASYPISRIMSIGTPIGSSNSNFSVLEADYTKMKLVYFGNEFPHDDLGGLLRELHTHSKDRRHPILAQFLDEATLAIREEVRQLPVTLRDLVPPFETIVNLADFTELRKGPLSGSVDGVLLSLVQLGTFIG